MDITEATGQFITAYTGIKRNELKNYHYTFNLLTAYTGDIPIEQINISTLRGWRSTLTGQATLWQNHPTKPAVNRALSPFTVYGHVSRVRHFFQWLVDEEIISKSPAKRLELPRLSYQPQEISVSDIDKMIAYPKTERDQLLLMLLIESGCRVGGLVSLTVEELDLVNCRAWAIEKGNKNRYIYFSLKTSNNLKTYLKNHQIDSGRVFCGKRGPLTTSGVYQVLKRIAKKAGVVRFNPHTFRHACARRMIAHSASIEDVAAVLGHTTSEVTRRYYAPWQDAEIQKRHQRFAWYGDSPTGKNSV